MSYGLILKATTRESCPYGVDAKARSGWWHRAAEAQPEMVLSIQCKSSSIDAVPLLWITGRSAQRLSVAPFEQTANRIGSLVGGATVVPDAVDSTGRISAFLPFGWTPQWDVRSLLEAGWSNDQRSIFEGVSKVCQPWIAMDHADICRLNLDTI